MLLHPFLSQAMFGASYAPLDTWSRAAAPIMKADELYKKLRTQPVTQLWTNEVPDFDAATAKEREQRVAFRISMRLPPRSASSAWR